MARSVYSWGFDLIWIRIRCRMPNPLHNLSCSWHLTLMYIWYCSFGVSAKPWHQYMPLVYLFSIEFHGGMTLLLFLHSLFFSPIAECHFKLVHDVKSLWFHSAQGKGSQSSFDGCHLLMWYHHGEGIEARRGVKGRWWGTFLWWVSQVLSCLATTGQWVNLTVLESFGRVTVFWMLTQPKHMRLSGFGIHLIGRLEKVHYFLVLWWTMMPWLSLKMSKVCLDMYWLRGCGYEEAIWNPNLDWWNCHSN